MANNIANILNSRVRLSGMASGLDTDSMIKQLMKVESYKVDKIKQDKQILEWKRDNYRSTTTLLTSFKNDFFDVLKPTSNMRSESNYKQYSAVSSDSNAISATATSAALSGSHTITATQLATAANAVSSVKSSADIGGFIFASQDFNITLNGVTENITLNGDYTDIDGLKLGLQSAIDVAFGADKITVGNNGDKLQFSTNNGNISISTGSTDVFSLLKIASGASDSVTKDLESTPTGLRFNNRDFNITLNGVTKNIKITNAIDTADGLRTALETSINAAFGAGKITVVNNAGKIGFDADNGKITLAKGTSDASNALAQLGIASGSSNRLNLFDKLSATQTNTALSGTLAFKINGVNFSFDTSITTTKTMNDVMTEINSSAANVTMTYSEVTDKFTLTSKTKGSGEAIAISNTSGNLFGASSAIGIPTSAINNGQDAKFNLDGITGIVRSDNNFTIDGLSYNINELNKAVTVTVNQDVDGVYNKIKNFVDKYNEIIKKVNTTLQEERNKDFLPLTDEQRESMSEDEITKWEANAKSGMLRNDSLLTGITDNIRRALYDSIKDVPGGLSSLGITTDNYFLSTKSEKGKLIIDETKLKETIRNSPDKVMNIFSKESTVAYSADLTSTQKSTRYDENGVIQRIYDILQDNIRTTRNVDGKKGTLLEKAGIIGDMTEYDSLLPDQIETKDKLISDMLRKLTYKEESYYRKFSALETAMSKMNSQSSWLSQQLGGGQ